MSDHHREPRPGLLPGAWDRLVGPGATQTENAGTMAAAILGAAIGLTASPPDRASWGPLRRCTATLVGADLFGGVWANATPAATRWYHGRGQGACEMVVFSALHIHPFLVAALHRDRDWGFAFGNYAYLLAATAVTATAPAPLRRAGSPGAVLRRRVAEHCSVATHPWDGMVPHCVLPQAAGKSRSCQGPDGGVVPASVAARIRWGY